MEIKIPVNVGNVSFRMNIYDNTYLVRFWYDTKFNGVTSGICIEGEHDQTGKNADSDNRRHTGNIEPDRPENVIIWVAFSEIVGLMHVRKVSL